MDGGVEGGCIEASLVDEVMCLEIAPDKIDVDLGNVGRKMVA